MVDLLLGKIEAKFLYTNTQKKSKLYPQVGVTVVTKLIVTSSSNTKSCKNHSCRLQNLEEDNENIAHSVTLTPRLEYSASLLDEIVNRISQKRDDLKQSNKDLISDFDESDKTHLQAIEHERTMAFSLEILTLAKRKTKSITNIRSIPQVLPSSIPLI